MRKRIHTALAAAILAACASPVTASHLAHDAVPESKTTELDLYVTAEEAYEMKRANPEVLLVDIRSNAEVAFLGMPTIADANVPYLRLSEALEWDARRGTLKLEPNPDFPASIDALRRRLGRDTDQPMVLICRSGKRSARAVDLLAGLGYTRVYTVVDGYEGDAAKEGPAKGQRVVNGWKNRGLPWSYKLDEGKIVRASSW